MTVIIAGGGIGGLALALTLDQIGVPALVLEQAQELQPLGVGVNLQPNAVRELYELGIGEADLDRVGIAVREWALVGLNGNEIYSEPRGLLAGYHWPQYAVDRGLFHVLLYQKLIERAGTDVVRLDHRITGYANNADGTVTVTATSADGATTTETGALLVGADGIHSAIRAQMHAEQPPIHWGGAIMWRGTTRTEAVRTGSSFVGLGTHRQRLIVYPISLPDPLTGLSKVNWIAEVTLDNPDDWRRRGWFRRAEIGDVIHHFEDWTYGWLDVPSLLRNADVIYENPMIDRDPVPTWLDGSVVLLGDAAHAMYPTGSNGASQAIIDARVLGACMIEHGITRDALTTYDAVLCGPISELVLRNRGAGPFGILNTVNERCGGEFENIDDVISPEERAEFMNVYKTAAGFAIDRLNGSKSTIETGAVVSSKVGLNDSR